jgi:uncharacterized protein YdhG (YjbR/CyaY superfamily)
MIMRKIAKTVDEYIAAAPKEAQAKLAQLRGLIKAVVPEADEHISYGMPYFGYKGRLAYFRLGKTHIGLYITPPVIAEHASELKNYGTSTATVRFALDSKLPGKLIQALIRDRMKKNEEENKK